MNEERLRDRLRAAAPVDPSVRERSWRVVRAEYASHPPPRRSSARNALAVLLVSLATGITAVGVAAASAPQSEVGRWVRGVLGVRDREARTALVHVPGGGRLLAGAGGAVWTVSADGMRRRLGSYDGASWSPRGRFVVAWRGRVLTAVEPAGRPRWSLTTRDPITVARWAPVDGFRIAYLTGGGLRVVNGDGTGDRRLASAGAATAPAWRPDADHVIAFVDARARVTVTPVDGGRRLWRSRPLGHPRQLAWSPGGERLLVLTRSRLLVFDRSGRLRVERAAASGTSLRDADWSPRGRELAVVRHVAATGRSEVVLLDGRLRREQSIFAGPGRLAHAEWSADGRWLLVPWPAADQWLFLRAAGQARLTAVAGISRQFSPGAAQPRFPATVEWCCQGGRVRPR